MKVTIVGFWGGYPAPGSATSAYLVEKDNFTLVIDMGSGALAQLQKYKKVSDIDAVILSHYHHDHIADVGVLQYAKVVESYVTRDKCVLPIYGHKEDLVGFSALTHDYTEGIVYDPNEALTIGPFSITFLRTVHSAPCFGMRVTDGDSVFVYTADTAYTDAWIEFAANADMLLTDCNFYAEQDAGPAGHMNSTEGANIAREANVGTLILSHLPQYGDNKQLVKEAAQVFTGNVHLAHEGFIWKKERS